MGTPHAERRGDAVHAICAESPLALLAIHTPTRFQNENGLKAQERTNRVKCALRKSVSQAQRMCFLTHRPLIGNSVGNDKCVRHKLRHLQRSGAWRSPCLSGLMVKSKKLADGPVSRILCRTHTVKRPACAAIIQAVLR